MVEYIYGSIGEILVNKLGAVYLPREEIVRCMDCKYSNETIWPAWSNIPHDYLDCCGDLVETWDYYNDQPNMNPVKPDGFCAWGVRRGR